jgi:hypothetical protein
MLRHFDSRKVHRFFRAIGFSYRPQPSGYGHTYIHPTKPAEYRVTLNPDSGLVRGVTYYAHPTAPPVEMASATHLSTHVDR